ncbi:MAG TPA: LysR family transcriptional regulator [Solirubrobacteraceae bacterium]
MDLRQLEHFVAVAEERSFTRASGRLHIVQSAVSASIRALERDLQTELFNRTTQRVRLSDAGTMLLPQARRILAEVVSARELVTDVRAGLRGTLTIGTMQALSAGPVDIVGHLAEFRVSHPLLEIRLRHVPGGSSELAHQLRDGGIDIAFLSLPERRPAGIALTPLASEPMMLICPEGHRLAKRRSIRLSELAGEPFVDHPSGWGTRMTSDRAFAAAGMERTVVFEVGDSASVVDLARHGLGVALLPASLVADTGGLGLVPLRGGALVWEVSLALPANRPVSAAADAFAQAAARSLE